MQYVAPVFILATPDTGIVARQYVAPVFNVATPDHRYCYHTEYMAQVFILATPGHMYCCNAVCGSSVYRSYTRSQILLLYCMWLQCLS